MDRNEDSQGCIEELEDLVREFDALPRSEKAESFYAVVDALSYIVSQHNRVGRSGNAASKRVVTAVRKARKAGAPDDAKHMNTVLNAYSRTVTPKNGLKEKMLADAALWSSPLYKATADRIIARSIVEAHTSILGDIDIEGMTPEERSEVLDRLDSEIEVLDAQDDVGRFAWGIVDSYAMRGIVADRKGDLDLEVDCISFFAAIGKLDQDMMMRMAAMITSHVGVGSLTMKRLLTLPGSRYARDVSRRRFPGRSRRNPSVLIADRFRGSPFANPSFHRRRPRGNPPFLRHGMRGTRSCNLIPWYIR